METQPSNEEMEQAPVVSYEGMVLESAVLVEDNCILFSLQKLWVRGEPRIVADNYAAGYIVTPPYGKEIIIAFPIDTNRPAQQPKDSIKSDQFGRVLERMVEQMKSVRTVAEQKPGGF